MSWSILADPCMPADGEPVQRNKGVVIVLNSTMVAAWRNSGECWRAISSRIFSIHIQLHEFNSKNGKK